MLDKTAATPLYIQLKNVIERSIEEGTFPEGKAIPSERELCQTYGVSRITVRQSIAQAISEGLLFRRQGKGTFVVRKKIDQTLERITGFDRTIAGQGLVPVTSLIDIRRIPASEKIASALAIDIGSPTIKMVLVGMAGTEPLAVYTSHFGLDTGMVIGEKAVELSRRNKPFTSLDLYALAGGVKPARARQTLEAALASGSVARLLKVKEPTPVFVISSVVEASDGTPIEYRVVNYRADRYRFSITREVDE
ncbi:MAG: GntR family transcriptional regulator [Ignavibacteriales bacterium]